MPHPGRGLLQGPCQLRERGGSRHQQTQNIHAAGIRKEFDFVKGLNSLNSFHFCLTIKESLFEVYHACKVFVNFSRDKIPN